MLYSADSALEGGSVACTRHVFLFFDGDIQKFLHDLECITTVGRGISEALV